MGPFKCPDCGVWWAGFEHRCRTDPEQMRTSDGTGPVIVYPYVGPSVTGQTTAAPWCGICKGPHIPGAGPCTGTWSGS